MAGPTARAVIDYIGRLTLHQGRLAGQPFPVRPWQSRFLRGLYGSEGDAALTVARGCGKSTLIAAAALAHLNGPAAQPSSEVVIAASSFGQGHIIFRSALQFLGPEIKRFPGRFRVRDSTGIAEIMDRETSVTLRCLGNDHRRLHGLQPALAILDELAQWPPSTIDRSMAAIRTSLGKIPNSRLVAIGTRPDAPDHEFQRLLDGGATYSQVHAARPDDPPFQRKTWARANPGLQYLPDLEKQIRLEADRARKDQMALASFQALRLNLGVSDSVENMLCTSATWLQHETDQPDRSGPFVLGVDLGQSASLSGVSGYWWTTGYSESFAVLPEQPSLHDRGIADGCGRLYEVAHDGGEIVLRGARVADIEGLLKEVLERWGAPAAIACDRVRRAELVQSLEAVGYTACPVNWRGMGYIGQGEDLRLFKSALLDGRVRPLKSLLTRASVGGARLTRDPAGNEKITKSGHAKARDDVAVAVVVAVAEGRRRAAQAAARKPFRYAIA